MKKLLLSILMITFLMPLYSQKMAIGDIVDKIRQVDLFIQYGKFKSLVVNRVSDLANHPNITKEDYNRLKLEYDEMSLRYNRFLELIKSDLSKWTQIKAMAKNPDKFASRYMDEYETVISYYDKSFKKELEDIDKKINGETKAFGLGTILLIIEEARPFIKSIVNWIKKRRDDKDEAKNLILMTINERLFEPLKMKEWNKFIKSKPVNSQEDEVKKMDRPYLQNEDLTLIDNEEFKGGLFFTWCTKDCDQAQNSDAKKISFKTTAKSVKKSKSITVGTFDGPESQRLQKALRFSSSEKFGQKGFMQLNIKTDAAVYVFAYNTAKEKKIEPVYPFPVDQLNQLGYSEKETGSNTKSITVSPFFETSEEDGTRTIPAPIKQNGKNVPLFMSVNPDSEEEYIAVLISKKQLPEDFYQEVEEADGSNLETRLYNVLGKQLVSTDNSEAKIVNSEGEISFDVSKLKEGLVLGLIFVLRH